MNNTTLILREVIQLIEQRRDELDRSTNLRGIAITVRLKTGVIPTQVQYSYSSVDLGNGSPKET